MNKIEYIRNGIMRIVDIGKSLSPQIGKSKFWIISDFLKSYILYGCNEEDYLSLEFYKKSNFEKNKFTTSRRNLKWLFKHHYTEVDKTIFRSKTKFNSYYSQYINRKWISSENSSIEAINRFIEEMGEVIVKPDLGLQGIGVFKMNADDTPKRNELIKFIKQGKEFFVIEEIIKQHPDLAYFNDSCVNTCRIETITDRSGKAHLVNTILISGGKNSLVSNTHTGGVMMHIDPELGVIDSKGRNPDGKIFNIHPATGAFLLGKKIPFWEETKSLALSLAEKRPSARLIGWDIAITDNGPEIIEGNFQPGHCTQSTDMIGRWPLIKSYL